MIVRRKYILGFVIVIFVVVVGAFILINQLKKTSVVPVKTEVVTTKTVNVEQKVIGKSVEGRDIEAYIYGHGATHLMFVGGIHGGYEWNSVVLAYEIMDYLKANPDIIPKNLTIAVIPSANPDGLYQVVHKEGRIAIEDIPDVTLPLGTGRFNAHNVDLNRNFDCKWQPKSMWQNKVESAGTKVFSEPEAVTIRDFVSQYVPKSVVFWHSKSNSVYASQCEKGILSETLNIMNVYAKASGYYAVKTFDAYQTTGDSEGWLASINIPAITIELKTHETVELTQNLAGVKALFKYYEDVSAL